MAWAVLDRDGNCRLVKGTSAEAEAVAADDTHPDGPYTVEGLVTVKQACRVIADCTYLSNGRDKWRAKMIIDALRARFGEPEKE